MFPEKRLIDKKDAIQNSFIPKNFFLTSGKATSHTSALNAFDSALLEAGIAQCNLVSVSSILPPEAKPIKPSTISPGSITYAVISRMDGLPGESICSGIGWGWAGNGLEVCYGLVAEDQGHKTEETVEEELYRKLGEMSQARGLKIHDCHYRTEYMEVPESKYGCVLVALVYEPWSI